MRNKFNEMDEYEKPELKQFEKRFLKRIQKQIHYCELCQAYDDGEIFWVYGERINLYELLCDFDLSEESIERIIKNLYCPYCGNEHLSKYSEVGLEDLFDVQNKKHLA